MAVDITVVKTSEARCLWYEKHGQDGNEKSYILKFEILKI